MEKRYFNMPRRLTDNRRFSKDEKEVLAAWLGMKFAFANSILYNLSTKTLMQFFHISFTTAKKLEANMRKDEELFHFADRKHRLFAKSCKDKVGHEPRRNYKTRFYADDVFTIEVPQCYLAEKREDRRTLPLVKLVRLIEEALVRKEYDDNSEYKSKKGGQKADNLSCGTRTITQESVARKTGLSRIKVNRILKDLVKRGIFSRTEMRIERCKAGEPYSFKGVNKKNGMPYYAKCMPATYTKRSNDGVRFMYVIWNHKKRVRAKFVQSTKRMVDDIRKSVPNISEEELKFKIMVKKYFLMHEIYD